MDARGAVERLARALRGQPMELPLAILRVYPMLGHASWRRGGLAPRLGGWCLGRATVSGIALGRTVFLAPHVPLDPWLLLHEFAHVRQFAEVSAFPLRYLWQSLRHGYRANRFEQDANNFATRVLAERSSFN